MQMGLVLAAVATIMGILSQSSLWGHRAGPGWLALVLLSGGFAWWWRRRTCRVCGAWVLMPWLAALAFAGGMLVFDGEVVHWLGPWLCGVTLGLAGYWTVAGPAPVEALGYPGGLLQPFDLVRIQAEIPDGLREIAPSNGERTRRLLLGLLLAVPLVGLFGLLFLSADPIYSRQMNLGLEQLDQWVAPSARAALMSVLFMGLLRHFARNAHPGLPGEAPRQGDPLVLGVALGSLNLLFLSFLAVQATYLFGGRAVLALPGLTLAEYARHGFFELTAATLLVLALTLAIYRLVHLRAGAGTTMILLALLVLQTFGLAASAIKRMDLYIASYGLTLTRTYVEMALVGICLTLLLTLYALARRPQVSWLTARILVLGMGMMAAAALLDVERLVAEVNAGRIGQPGFQVDVAYLGTLSCDVLPVLQALEQHQDASIREQARQARLAILQRLQQQQAWQDWNLSRARAWPMLADLEAVAVEPSTTGPPPDSLAAPATNR